MDRGSDGDLASISAGSQSPADANTGTTSTRRRPIPRKGHTKSRAGCLTCKRRKVKCDEFTPECSPCRRLGLDCAYLQRISHDGEDNVSTPRNAALVKSLRSDPLTFTLDDMRFFQHFLFAAYPSLPIDGWLVWQYVSQMSYQFDFLVHSMLGLGASHLNLVTAADYSQASLSHRVTAIKGLNEFLSHAHLSHVNADVAFATMLSLTFQASHMPDGLIEWLTMVRGCYLVGSHCMENYESSAFKTFERQHYLVKVMELVHVDDTTSCLDRMISEEFCESARRLAPLCSSVAEIEYLAMMQRIVRGAANEPTTNYYVHVHTKMYDKLGELSPEDFTTFIDPENHPARLVIIHMLAVDFIMSRRIPLEGSKILHYIGLHQGYDFRKAMSVVWIENVMQELPKKYVPYGRWVLKFVHRFMETPSIDGIVWRPPNTGEERLILPDIEIIASRYCRPLENA